MNAPTIRLARKDDLAIIVAFNRAMAAETEDVVLNIETLEAGVNNLFEDQKLGFYIVGEINSQVRSCLMITYEWSDWRNGLFWWIQSVYVDPGFRKKGLYKEMYKFIKTKVDQDKSIAGIRLYVDENNSVAKHVYNHLGMNKSNYELFEYVKR